MIEQQPTLEKERLLIKGIIAPVIHFDTSGKPRIYTLSNYGYKSSVNSGEIGLLSETYASPRETWKEALSRCLGEELMMKESQIAYLLQKLRVIDMFSHPFSHRKPESTNGYNEDVKYNDYFANPTGIGDVVVIHDLSDEGILPVGIIGTSEVESAYYREPWELFDRQAPIRQSYNSRVILSEIASRGILSDSALIR